MKIPTWILPAPVLLAPGQRVAAFQLRELTLRFPPDAPAGGSLVVTAVGPNGPYPDALAVALDGGALAQLKDVLGPGILEAVAELLNTHDVCDVRTAALEAREHVLPTPPVDADAPTTSTGLGGTLA